jgi:hypothetical protein
MTQLTVSDILREHTIMTPETVAAVCRIHTFEGRDGARIASVFARMHLTIGMLSAWIALHSYRLRTYDDIRGNNSPEEEDNVFSRAKILLVLKRVINDIHRESNFVFATTMQTLLQEIAESMISEICHGFIRRSSFTEEFVLSYDLGFYCD